MPAPAGPVLPIRLIVLDLLGTLVVAAGVFELFSDESALLPEAAQFPGHALLLIVIGLAIMLPAVFGIVQHYLKSRQGR
jgi:hypothetical protein